MYSNQNKEEIFIAIRPCFYNWSDSHGWCSNHVLAISYSLCYSRLCDWYGDPYLGYSRLFDWYGDPYLIPKWSGSLAILLVLGTVFHCL